MSFLEIFRRERHKIQESDNPKPEEKLPELITLPERSRRLCKIERDYLEGKILYETLVALRSELYDPRRVCISSPNDTRVATRAPSEK